MKKTANSFAALAAAALIALSACSGNAKSDASAEAADSTAATAAEAPEATADPVTEIAAGTPDLSAYKGRLTVVDFNAVWCGPCRQYGPTFHAVAAKKAADAAFLSVNVDSCQEIAQTYVGQFIPQTTVIRPNGEYVSKAGQLSEAELTAFIDSVAALD